MPNLNIMDINYRPCLIECDVSLFEPESETEPQHYDKVCVEEVKLEEEDRTFTENRFPNLGNFRCDICTSVVSTQTQLDNHKKIHAKGSVKFYCEECDKCFASNKNLVRHQKSHSTTENEIKEEIIESSLPPFVTQITLNPSSEIKKEVLEFMPPLPFQIMLRSDKSYACQKCSAKFANQSQLDGHMRAHDGKNFNCKKCDRCFVSNQNLKRHLKLHLKQSQYSNSSTRTVNKCLVKLKRIRLARDKLDCKICLKRFSQLKYLNQHTRTHSSRTQDSSSLAVHTRRHTSEKPFKCDFCDEGFLRSADLITHRRIHTGEKQHLCNICGKSFAKSNKLTRHMRTHTRPYKCTYCDRAFAELSDLTIHIRRHTGEKPYACGICGERFIQRTVLDHHRKVKGHYADVDGVEVSYAHLTQNTPNPKNKSNRVDQIGNAKLIAQKSNSLTDNEVGDITPLNMEIIEHKNYTDLKKEYYKKKLELKEQKNEMLQKYIEKREKDRERNRKEIRDLLKNIINNNKQQQLINLI